MLHNLSNEMTAEKTKWYACLYLTSPSHLTFFQKQVKPLISLPTCNILSEAIRSDPFDPNSGRRSRASFQSSDLGYFPKIAVGFKRDRRGKCCTHTVLRIWVSVAASSHSTSPHVSVCVCVKFLLPISPHSLDSIPTAFPLINSSYSVIRINFPSNENEIIQSIRNVALFPFLFLVQKLGIYDLTPKLALTAMNGTQHFVPPLAKTPPPLHPHLPASLSQHPYPHQAKTSKKKWWLILRRSLAPKRSHQPRKPSFPCRLRILSMIFNSVSDADRPCLSSFFSETCLRAACVQPTHPLFIFYAHSGVSYTGDL